MLKHLLQNLVFLWIAMGFLDWVCHRKSKIEETTGLSESLFHLLQLFITAAGFAIAVFWPINVSTLFILSLLWSTHQFVTWIELSHVTGSRVITALEQMVHSFMEVLPLTAIMLLAVLMVGNIHQGAAIEPLAYHWEDDLRFSILASLGVLTFIAFPFLEEFLRCLRVRRRRMKTPLPPVERHQPPP